MPGDGVEPRLEAGAAVEAREVAVRLDEDGLVHVGRQVGVHDQPPAQPVHGVAVQPHQQSERTLRVAGRARLARLQLEVRDVF